MTERLAIDMQPGATPIFGPRRLLLDDSVIEPRVRRTHRRRSSALLSDDGTIPTLSMLTEVSADPLTAGRCAEIGPDIFSSGHAFDVQAAKRVCAGCEVAALCLSYALKHDERFGIWGGKTFLERRKLPPDSLLEKTDDPERHPADSGGIASSDVPGDTIRTRPETLADILKTTPDTPEFYASLRYYFGWKRAGTTPEQKVQCFRLVRAKGYSYLAAARTVGITRDAATRAVKALDAAHPELRVLILGSHHSAVLDEVV